jgi:hypothetical protein
MAEDFYILLKKADGAFSFKGLKNKAQMFCIFFTNKHVTPLPHFFYVLVHLYINIYVHVDIYLQQLSIFL